MPKPVFVEKMDNDDNDIDFEFASHIYIFSARDNQTQGSIVSQNIAGLFGEQGLSITEFLKKNNLMNSCITIGVIG